MVKKASKAELEALGIADIESLCEEAGIDVTRFTKAELIDRLLEAEGEPTEPTEPTGEGTGEGGEGSGEGEGGGEGEPGDD